MVSPVYVSRMIKIRHLSNRTGEAHSSDSRCSNLADRRCDVELTSVVVVGCQAEIIQKAVG